jgi:8-oxo-dGTP pyrophosphatase MutT (NUDIX family)
MTLGVNVPNESHIPGDLPQRDLTSNHPVKPKDSASIIILKKTPKGVQVLMGKRGRKAVFSNAYVFAGGKVDPEDFLPKSASELNPDIVKRISSAPAKSISFAMAAVRESYEETGLLLGAPGDVGETGNSTWDEIRLTNLAPDLEKMNYVGHAITPASKAVRFNARFFCAWEHDMTGRLSGSGELSDLAFLNLSDALKLPMVDVTEFMLEEMIRREKTDFATPPTYPFFGYRKDRQFQRYS